MSYGSKQGGLFWRLLLLFLLFFSSRIVGEEGQMGCPSESDILPCRCSMREDQLQIWCTHSDLTRVLGGLQAVAAALPRPVDELILENNFLPSLPGSVFSALRVARLMLRHNGMERVAGSWLSGLEDTLLEIFIVEPYLRSLPADSLEQLRALEAITLQGGAMKRLPRFSGLPRLRYLHVQTPALVELSPLAFKSLPDLEQMHVMDSPHLTRLEGGLLQDLPRLRFLNISNCGLTWIHPRALARLPNLKELSLQGNRLSDAGAIGRATRELPALEVLRLDSNFFNRLDEASFVDLPALREISLGYNRITEVARGAFHRVPALRRLDLSHNAVRRVQPEAFLGAPSLEEFFLVHNELEHVADLRTLLLTLPRLRYLDVSYNLLEDIPFGALPSHPALERLHLDHNRLQHVQREAFAAMPALRELRLRNNSLSNFLDGPLWNLPGLKGLDLAYNYFRRLEPRFLVNLPSLRRLDLSGNALEIIEPGAFLPTPALEHVNLSRNALSSSGLHPATFRDLAGLYELDLGWNRLRELPPVLPRAIEYLHASHNQMTGLSMPLALPALKLLDLSGNGLTRLPPRILSGLPQLKRLYLGENSLQLLQEGSLIGLTRLEVLDLHNNKLADIENRAMQDASRVLYKIDLSGNRLERISAEHLKEATGLKVLDLSHNRIREIDPGALANARNVEEMDLSHNMLEDFPSAVTSLGALEALDLSSNQVASLPNLSSLNSLTELRLAKNRLRTVNNGALAGLPHLVLLDMDNNQVENVASGAISTLPELRAVRFGHNKLSVLPSGAFSDLPQLQSVELQENQLIEVAPDAFSAVPQLLLLNLSHNQLTELQHAGLKSLRSLEVLDLSNNQIAHLGSGSLNDMEWLVELKMDNNRICSIHGAPFDTMPRLRVLSLRNNRMTVLAEQVFARLRNNIAMLDIDGNPLACSSCGIIWLQAWLKELPTAGNKGPRCSDGSLLHEARLSRQECTTRNEEPPVPGCERDHSGPSQVVSTWVEVKDGTSQAPTPEESEYFYDEYVEYQYDQDGNSSTSVISIPPPTGNRSSIFLSSEIPLTVDVSPTVQASLSPHLIPGDTPTFYAGSTYNKTNITKQQQQQQSSAAQSGSFTFFGIPLPSLSLGGLWGTAGRNADAKPKSPVRGFVGGRGKVQMLPSPESGFMPVLPGTGGFVPIPGPHLPNTSHHHFLHSRHKNDTSGGRPGAITFQKHPNSAQNKFTAHSPASTTLPLYKSQQSSVPVSHDNSNSFGNHSHPIILHNEHQNGLPINKTKPSDNVTDHLKPTPNHSLSFSESFLKPSNNLNHQIHSTVTSTNKSHFFPDYSVLPHSSSTSADNSQVDSFHHSLSMLEKDMYPHSSLEMNNHSHPVSSSTEHSAQDNHSFWMAPWNNNVVPHTTKNPEYSLSPTTTEKDQNNHTRETTHKEISLEENLLEPTTTAVPEDDEIVTKRFSFHLHPHSSHENQTHEDDIADGAGWGFVDWLGRFPQSADTNVRVSTNSPMPTTAATSTSTAKETSSTSSSVISNLWGMITTSNKEPTPLSAFLAPGGQQPAYRPPGRSTITKVAPPTTAPNTPTEEFLRGEPKSRSLIPIFNINVPQNSSTDWYYKNYNKTNLEPFVGPGRVAVVSSHQTCSAVPLLLLFATKVITFLF